MKNMLIELKIWSLQQSYAAKGNLVSYTKCIPPTRHPPRPPSAPHLSSRRPRRGPLGARVSFVFGAMAPVEGLQGIRGSGGQLLLCFNWHYHFSRLTEMDHPAGPCYCRHRGVEARGRGRGGEESEKVSAWWAR